jgi:redox-sensitive bicupin YhaK (pirin superfamily)
MIQIRRSDERGHADHGWLDSYHSFSFADYHDPEHISFGPLRVINEDRVKPGTGFGTHGHRDMEIVSYVLEGALAHKDSMGTGSTIRPGDVQRMSAGRGVTHSEFNSSASEPVHFLQIWIIPSALGTAPGYEQRHFPAAEKRGRLRLIASPDGAQDSVRLQQDARILAGLFDGAEELRMAWNPQRLLYVHVARGVATVNGHALGAGDALQGSDTAELRIAAASGAELLVFDLPAGT